MAARSTVASVVAALHQIVVGETYPGLHAPKFKRFGTLESLREPSPVRAHGRVVVEFAYGREASRRLAELVPRIQMKKRHAIDGALRRQGVAKEPEALRAWLRAQVRDHFPGREPVRIELQQVEDGDPPRVTPLLVAAPGGAA